MKRNLLDYEYTKIILSFLVFSFPLVIVFRSFSINFVTILISFIILSCIFYPQIKKILRNNLIIYISIFFAYLFLNSIINYNSYEIVLKSIGNFRYLLLSISVVLVLNISSDSSLKKFILLNIFLLTFICLDIFFQYFNLKNIFGFYAGMCDNEGLNCSRFSGIFNDELIAGSYLSQIGILILLLIQKLSLDVNKQKFLKVIFFFLLLITILISGERNAFIILLLSVLFYFLFQKKFKNLLITASLIFILIFLFIKNSQSVYSRYIAIDSSYKICKDCSIFEKLKNNPWAYHYIAAFELFKKKPFFGHGTKSFRVKCHDTKIQKILISSPHKFRGYQACSTHPHNYSLELLSEYGLTGFLFYVGLIIFILSETIKKFSYQITKNILILFGLGSLILAILFPFKPSGSFLNTFNASILFYLLGFFIHFQQKVK